MRQTQINQVTKPQLPGDDTAREFLLAAQSDLLDLGESYQGERVKFPAVPNTGGWLATRKGLYEGIFTDDATPQPRWRRLSSGVLYEPGDDIPVTL